MTKTPRAILAIGVLVAVVSLSANAAAGASFHGLEPGAEDR